MKYGNVWISMTPDCDENSGGYYCQVYDDENMENQIDDFCIHAYDCDCIDSDAVESFLKRYANMYQKR